MRWRIDIPDDILFLDPRDSMKIRWIEDQSKMKVYQTWQSRQFGLVKDWFHDHLPARLVMILYDQDNILGTEFADDIEPAIRHRALLFSAELIHRAQSGFTKDLRSNWVYLLTDK